MKLRRVVLMVLHLTVLHILVMSISARKSLTDDIVAAIGHRETLGTGPCLDRGDIAYAKEFFLELWRLVIYYFQANIATD